MSDLSTLEYAIEMDQLDPIAKYRDDFHFPSNEQGTQSIYLCGNSLGLQPKSAQKEINDVIHHWQERAVEGHFEGENGWIGYNDGLKPSLGRIVGALSHEVAIANTLTVNLHLLMISFYKPKGKRYKILIEKDAFPSDKYAVASQIKMHGYEPSDAVIEVAPRHEEYLLNEQDILNQINQHKDELALVLLGGVNYITGQLLPIKSIAETCQLANVTLGLDLAHAAGNVPLSLHEHGVDFAVWCNYKYLNGGPGAIGSFFIHEKHHDTSLPRLEGWWGNSLASRFEMDDTFQPERGAEAWVMSTPPTLAIAPLKASLAMFDAIGLEALRQKSIKLTRYLEHLINLLNSPSIRIITPQNPNERGCQLSIAVENANKSLFHSITSRNVMLDWREPNVIRVSPTPLYNTFQDVYHFVNILKELM